MDAFNILFVFAIFRNECLGAREKEWEFFCCVLLPQSRHFSPFTFVTPKSWRLFFGECCSGWTRGTYARTQWFITRINFNLFKICKWSFSYFWNEFRVQNAFHNQRGKNSAELYSSEMDRNHFVEYRMTWLVGRFNKHFIENWCI